MHVYMHFVCVGISNRELLSIMHCVWCVQYTNDNMNWKPTGKHLFNCLTYIAVVFSTQKHGKLV